MLKGLLLVKGFLAAWDFFFLVVGEGELYCELSAFFNSGSYFLLGEGEGD